MKGVGYPSAAQVAAYVGAVLILAGFAIPVSVAVGLVQVAIGTAGVVALVALLIVLGVVLLIVAMMDEG